MVDRTEAPVEKENPTVTAGHRVLAGRGRQGALARLWPFLGPAFIASVAYIDPGNFATNIQGGAKFGYMLLWVIVLSNLMAMLIQTASAKLGIASGLNLAEQCREHLPRWAVYCMWVLMELVAMATDLAEFLGAELGLNLLLGIPLLPAGLLTAVVTFLILGLERYGFRPLEAAIGTLVGVVALCYLVEIVCDQPDWGNVAYHAVVPQFAGAESILLATGILGATVMPHAIFLHSALMQNRIVVRDPDQLRRLFRYEVIDVAIAMSIAGLVNAAKVTTRVVRGEPVNAIVAAARDFATDLIVLGTHGKTNLDAFWSESVTPQLARRSHLPMLLVPVRM